MNQPKVSIIVPVYNVEKYFQQCVNSLLNQTLADIEIILVNDGSSDNCPAMCDAYSKQDHRIKIIHKKNEGLGYARNSGIEIATGEYIAFVDSDDYVELNTYQKVYDLATDTKTDIVYFTYQRFDNHGNIWTKTSSSKQIQLHKHIEIRELMLDMVANRPKAKRDSDITCSSCCALYSNDLIQKHKLRFKSERELISEDRLFNLDYLSHSSRVIIVPDAFYYYRINLSSFSRTVRPDRIDKNYYYYQYLLDELRTNNFGKEGFLRATRLFIGYSRSSIRQYIKSSLSKREKMQWLKGVVNHSYWKEIASSYPYWQLPLKYALHFYLLHKGYLRLLYYYSKL